MRRLWEFITFPFLWVEVSCRVCGETKSTKPYTPLGWTGGYLTFLVLDRIITGSVSVLDAAIGPFLILFWAVVFDYTFLAIWLLIHDRKNHGKPKRKKVPKQKIPKLRLWPSPA